MNKIFSKSTMWGRAVMLLFAIVLSQLPLFNYLGYEFSVATALVISLIAGLSVIALFSKRIPNRMTVSTAELRSVLSGSIREGPVLLLIPAVVATLNAAFVKNCSYGEGILFYLLIPGVTLVWSVTLAVFCAVAARRAFALYVIVLFVVLLHPLYLGYTTPQIYSYNFIYGYFPGFSYDEILRISTPLIVFRGLTIVMAALLLLLTFIIALKRTKNSARFSFLALAGASVLCGIIIIVAWVFRVELSLETSTRHIQRTLGSHYVTQHFDIYYAHESFSNDEIRRVGTEHEFRFHQVATALQVAFDGRVSSYIYPDENMKRSFIGTGNTNIAKPWRREIHLNKDSWDDVLKHELVHVLAGEFGMPVIKAHYNIGLVEGLAMAIDPEFGNRTLSQYSAAIITFNLVRDPARLVKPVGFATQASTVSYVMMGAFCKYLIDRYGIVRFKELYGGTSVDDVYGMSYDRLAEEWQHSLERIDVPASSRRHVEFYFKRPSIFAKECVRTIADLNDRASRYLQKKNPIAAMELFHNALQTSWNTESYTGLVRSMFGAARYDSVIQLLNGPLRDSLRRSSIVNLFLLYGDALWYRGDGTAAQSIYGEILALGLSERYNEAAAVRLAVLSDERVRMALIPYFVGALHDTVALRLVDSLQKVSSSLVLQYIKAKITFRLHDYDSSLHTLESIPATFDGLILNAGREQLLGEAYFLKGNYQQARAHFWQSQNFLSNQASIDRVNDWLERCDWFEASKENIKSKK